MPTKIQIPSSGNPPATHVKKGKQCFWSANGNNTYNLDLPAGAFDEFPNGGTIQAANGGDSQTVTVSLSNQTGSTISVTFTQVSTAAAGAGFAATTTTTTTSGQSDIIVDPVV